MIHFFLQKKAFKTRYLTLKLGTSKTYDPIKWDYLEEVMHRGIKANWVELFMMCKNFILLSMDHWRT